MTSLQDKANLPPLKISSGSFGFAVNPRANVPRIVLPQSRMESLMAAIGIVVPKLRRLIGNTWQIYSRPLQGGISTTGGRMSARNPQAMGELAWH
jgi:hypothetical protein